MGVELAGPDGISTWAQEVSPSPTAAPSPSPIQTPPPDTPTSAAAILSIILAIAAAFLGYRILRGGKGL